MEGIEQSRAVVMLVGNNPDIRLTAALALSFDPGLIVLDVGSGHEALARLERPPRPDLVLIDNLLPDMDGICLAEVIRRTNSRPPFAFFTASVRARDHARYASVGAVGVIVKPFDPLRFADEVRALLSSFAIVKTSIVED